MLLAAGVIAAVIAVVAAVSLAGGSGGGATSSATTAASVKKTPAKTRSTPPVAGAAEIPVTILNGTETAGLAHRIATTLQRGGYSQASAQNGAPPGSGQVTVVEYAEGGKEAAEGVARTLSVTQVQPMEAAVSNLANSAKVVVVVGADKAAASP
jgi:hypothetical protein